MTNQPAAPTPHSETTYANLREAERCLIRAVRIESAKHPDSSLRDSIDKIATVLSRLIDRIDDGGV